MTKEDVSLAKLNHRLAIEKKRRAFSNLIDGINKQAVLYDTYIFKRNNRIIIRLYYPGVTRIYELTKLFRENHIHGYLDNAPNTQDYVEFVVYLGVNHLDDRCLIADRHDELIEEFKRRNWAELSRRCY